ncbi:MAG: hypothetical protein IJT22_05160 [Synergistaceae bacterium]|nr:hypothetical protein [Synergistaceae bacterium]
MKDKDYNISVHLGFIQNTINRMSEHSSKCKNWVLTLFAALAAFFFSSEKICGNNFIFLIMILIVLIVFWGLDAYYLKMERIFRRLYDKVRFANDETENTYDMSIEPFIKDEQSVVRIMFSKSICPVYLPLVLSVLLFMLSKIFLEYR